MSLRPQLLREPIETEGDDTRRRPPASIRRYRRGYWMRFPRITILS